MKGREKGVDRSLRDLNVIILSEGEGSERFRFFVALLLRMTQVRKRGPWSVVRRPSSLPGTRYPILGTHLLFPVYRLQFPTFRPLDLLTFRPIMPCTLSGADPKLSLKALDKIYITVTIHNSSKKTEDIMILENKVSLITGAARGIGKEIAMLFAREGSDLAICDVNEELLNATKAEIEKETGRKVITGKIDVTSACEVDEFIKKILDNFGNLDILVNNAGITRDNLVMRMSDAEWDAVLGVNLKGAFNCIKAVTRPMMKKRSGRIINMASIIGIMGNAGQANYAASKGGLIALTKTVAKELGSRNINVNAIAPGFIKTDMTDKLSEEAKQALLGFIPLKRMGSTQDVANIALFLAGEGSAYVTGQVITVDGGMVM